MATAPRQMNPEEEDGAPTEDATAPPVDSFIPDAAAQAWLTEQTKGLKAKNVELHAKSKRDQTRISELEARLTEAQERVNVLEGALGDDAHDIGPRLARLREFEAGNLKEQKIDENELVERGRRAAEKRYDTETKPKIRKLEADKAGLETEIAKLRAELREHRVTGRLRTAITGVVKPGYADLALAALGRTVQETEDGDLHVYDDGELQVDMKGDPMSPETFAPEYLRKRFPDLLIRDTALPNGGAAPPPGAKGGQEQKNPFKQGTINYTAQAQFLKNDPDMARRLIKAAGRRPEEFGLSG